MKGGRNAEVGLYSKRERARGREKGRGRERERKRERVEAGIRVLTGPLHP